MKKHESIIGVFITAILSGLSIGNPVEIRDFNVTESEVSFSFKEPENEYVLASTTDLENWDLGRIYDSTQSELNYIMPLQEPVPDRKFFVICELATTSRIHDAYFGFTGNYTEVTEGEEFIRVVGGVERGMKAQVPVTEGQGIGFGSHLTVDLNSLTINMFGSSSSLQPDGIGYAFEVVIHHPNELIEDASDDIVEYFSESTEIFKGRYDLCSGTITMGYTEISRLIWSLDSSVSIATTVASVVSDTGTPVANIIHCENFVFTGVYTVANEGEEFVHSSGSQMQAWLSVSVGDEETFSTSVTVNLDEMTIELLDETVPLVSAGDLFEFEIQFDYPESLIEEASDDLVQYYSQGTETFKGTFDPTSEGISMEFAEIQRLTWNHTNDESVAETVVTFVGSCQS